jgi:hypothetical protein
VLAEHLAGHVVTTVQQAGWSGSKSRKLLLEASGRFDVFLTIDQSFAPSHNIPADIGVVILRSRSRRMDDLLPYLTWLLRALERIEPGQSIQVGYSDKVGYYGSV